MAAEIAQDAGAWANYKAALAEMARAAEVLSLVQDEDSDAARAAELVFQQAVTDYNAARDRLRDSHEG